MELIVDPSKGKMKICSKSLKEEFIAHLRKMAYENQGIGLTMNSINYVMNKI
jgi:hypothetical protein